MFITLHTIQDKEYKVNPVHIVVMEEIKGSTVVILNATVKYENGDIFSINLNVKESIKKIQTMIKEFEKEQNERQVKLQQIGMELFYNKYMR